MDEISHATEVVAPGNILFAEMYSIFCKTPAGKVQVFTSHEESVDRFKVWYPVQGEA